MPRKRKFKFAERTASLPEEIRKASEGLSYTSETDAEISPFSGTKVDAVTKENLLPQIGNSADAPVEERDFTEFFERLKKIQDWFGDEEKQTAAKFAALQKLLQENLKDLKVFKVGKIELDIYVVGLDSESNLIGIQTKAVET